jgi:recombination protein RecT
MAVGLVERNDKLRECSPRSFALAVMACAELGLEPSLGQVYVIPYKETATLQIGFQGMIQIAMNSGLVQAIWADVVREGDIFTETHGTHRGFVHQKTGPKDGKITHAYAVAVMKGTNERSYVVLDRDDIEKRKAVSKTAGFNDGPWQLWPVEMCKKTAIRALYKMLPKSTQMLAAGQYDDDGTMGQQTRPISVPCESVAVPWEDTEEPKDDFFEGAE